MITRTPKMDSSDKIHHFTLYGMPNIITICLSLMNMNCLNLLIDDYYNTPHFVGLLLQKMDDKEQCDTYFRYHIDDILDHYFDLLDRNTISEHYNQLMMIYAPSLGLTSNGTIFTNFGTRYIKYLFATKKNKITDNLMKIFMAIKNTKYADILFDLVQNKENDQLDTEASEKKNLEEYFKNIPATCGPAEYFWGIVNKRKFLSKFTGINILYTQSLDTPSVVTLLMISKIPYFKRMGFVQLVKKIIGFSLL